jgi:hypothetical protein
MGCVVSGKLFFSLLIGWWLSEKKPCIMWLMFGTMCIAGFASTVMSAVGAVTS